MIARGLFINSISKFEFDSGIISLNFEATEINKDNIETVRHETGLSPYNIATLLEKKFYENFKEEIDQIQIIEGRSASPLMLTILTNDSSLTIGKAWFRNDSSISYDQFLETLFHIKNKFQIKLVNNTINLLMYGE